MRPRPPSLTKVNAVERDTEAPNADQLIRLLAGLALKTENIESDGTQHPLQTHRSSEEILVDMEFDGFRYLLVRLPKPTETNRVTLSPREQEIVRMVAEGHPNKVIAGVLNISGWTVCTHLRRIFAKLGVGSRAAMVAKLFDVGTMNHHHTRPAGACQIPAGTHTPSAPASFSQNSQKMSAGVGRR